MTTENLTAAAKASVKKTNVRWLVVAILFMITSVNYADRATLSMAGSAIQKELGLSAIHMGYIFSAFGWAYVIAQFPAAGCRDCFGSKRICHLSCVLSFSVMLQGSAAFFTGLTAASVLFCFRYLMATFEAPSFPANARSCGLVPEAGAARPRLFSNAAQYFATVIFAPIMGWIVHSFGWHYVFFVMGCVGLCMLFFWLKFIYDPKEHPMSNQAEVDYIAEGGGLVSMDIKRKAKRKRYPSLKLIKQLLTNRMFLGIYLAQYCINALTFFFISWFPVYLLYRPEAWISCMQVLQQQFQRFVDLAVYSGRYVL